MSVARWSLLVLLAATACSDGEDPIPNDAGVARDAGSTPERDGGSRDAGDRDAGAPEGLRITTTTLPAAVVGEAYTATVTSVGGEGALTWTLAQGTLPAGLALARADRAEALVEGTPTADGTFTVTLEVTDASSDRSQREFTIEVTAPALSIEIATLPAGTVGVPFAADLAARGGIAPFTWSVRGALPAGLALNDANASAKIEGTPTTAGTYAFTIELTDDLGQVATEDVTVEVSPPLALVTTALADGAVGRPFSAAIEATGGTGTGYVWSVESGALPGGLALAPSGTPSTTLAGTPSDEGTFTFTIRVEDDGGRVATASFEQEILPALGITPAGLNDRPICTGGIALFLPYSGVSPYTWSYSGALPDGWTFTERGPVAELTGRSTIPGDSTFSVTVVDATGSSSTATYTITIDDDPDAERWLLAFGEIDDPDRASISLVDVCGDTPGAIVPVGPTPVGAGEVTRLANPNGFSSDGGAVAFVGDLTTTSVDDLYLFDLTNPTAPAVTVASGGAFSGEVVHATWSPDGQSLVFTVEIAPGVVEPYVVDVSNRALPGTPQSIAPTLTSTGTLPTFLSDVHWAPDSSGLVMRANGAGEVYYAAVRPAPTPLARVHPPVTAGSSRGAPSWRADSSGVLFGLDLAGSNIGELWFANPGAGTLVRVNTSAYGPDQDIAFSDRGSTRAFNPQDTRLFYLADEAIDAVQELFLVDVTGPSFGAPTRAIAPLTPSRSVTEARWSPDGARIAFRANLDNSQVFDLYVVDVSGPLPAVPANVTHLPAFADIDVFEGFTWSHDGTRIAFMADRDTNDSDWTYFVDVSGSAPSPITTVSPMPTTAGLDTYRFEWSPNDRYLAMTGDFFEPFKEDLVVTYVGPGGPGLPQRVTPPLPPSGGVRRFRFRADGTGAFFTGDLFTTSLDELWMIDLSTRAVPPVPVAVLPAVASGVSAIELAP